LYKTCTIIEVFMKKKRLFIILFIIFIGITLVDVEAIGNVKLDGAAPYLETGRKVSCGDGLINNLPQRIVAISSTLYNAVMVIVPVLIILFGVIDLVKAIMAQKEDDIKKGKDGLIKRIITAVIVFLVVMIVKFATGVFAKDNGSNIVDCIDCFINAECDSKK